MQLAESKTTFGPWKVARYLSSGSFGHVYVVRQDGMKGEFALKWLKSDSGETGLKRMQNEVWAIQQLKHQHLPSYVDSGVEESLPFFVMTLARGMSLRRRYKAQRADGGTTSQLLALNIVIAVLEALEHMHSLSILHRDVKDDNIIATEGARDVTLIDLGFCKGHGQPNDVQTVWNAGAARYSPPSKLEHAAGVHPTHDVFAVGVVAYLLLTNQYPWDIADDEDAGVLRERMRTRKPIPVSVINTLVARELAEFIEALISIDDAHRPTASAAKKHAVALRTVLQERLAAPATTQGRVVSFPHVVRDAVHGDIRLTDFEWRILDSAEFQRLHRIKQLGFSSLVYPGAHHSRANHSLGTLHVADKILRSIEDRGETYFDAEERLLARTYALVHDVTHVAFGHTLEDELNVFERHDRNRSRLERLVLSDSSEVGALLKSTDFGKAAIELLIAPEGESRYEYIRELVAGPSGADVLDYIDRDSHFCGLDHRVDTAIYRRFSVTPTAGTLAAGEQRLVSQIFGRHGLRLDAEFALESVLLERFSLFMKVYTHPAKTAAGAMLGKAIAEVGGGRRVELNEERLESFGDDELLTHLRNSKRKKAAELAEQIVKRQLYKPAFQSRALPDDDRTPGKYELKLQQFRESGLLDPASRTREEEKLAREANVDAGDIIIYCVGTVPGLQKVRHYVEEKPGTPTVRDETHRAHLGAYERHLGLWSVYVFLAPHHNQDVFQRVRKAAEKLFSLTNEQAYEKRQGMLFAR